MTTSDVLSYVAAIFCSPPVHLLCFSTLTGTQLFQTFVITKVAFKALPKTAFVGLQKRLFPVYFAVQVALLLLTGLTFPPYGVAALARNKHDSMPLLVAGCAAGINLTIFGPKTRQAMLALFTPSRRDATEDGTAKAPNGFQSLKRGFSKYHAAAIHLNLVSVCATLCIFHIKAAGTVIALATVKNCRTIQLGPAAGQIVAINYAESPTQTTETTTTKADSTSTESTKTESTVTSTTTSNRRPEPTFGGRCPAIRHDCLPEGLDKAYYANPLGGYSRQGDVPSSYYLTQGLQSLGASNTNVTYFPQDTPLGAEYPRVCPRADIPNAWYAGGPARAQPAIVSTGGNYVRGIDCTDVTLAEGEYYPLRSVMGDWQGLSAFNLTIKRPSESFEDRRNVFDGLAYPHACGEY
ncbi:putative sucrose utilization protein SUC1 [Purpureocillium lavendulum]|uniref:Sucrose utilization protein SUC1 n=1 Tax=Purpureocillium lavendulum TaxID=1247861 RepID=A0AB34FKS9_9HYPO|nr:putative sucrose utilization protein SUC1 [Purpureocillium lavendulum]